MSDAEGPRGIHRRLSFEITDSLRKRFMDKVCQREQDECWYWSGAQRNGYGAIKHNGKVLSAHVLSFVLNGGVIHEGEIVLHSCDVKTCVNPKHLRAGTPGDNVREMYQRGIATAARGEGHVNASIDDKTAILIRSLRIVHGLGKRRISRLLGLTEALVDSVLGGKSWKHVIQPDMATMVELCRSLPQPPKGTP